MLVWNSELFLVTGVRDHVEGEVGYLLPLLNEIDVYNSTLLHLCLVIWRMYRPYLFRNRESQSAQTFQGEDLGWISSCVNNFTSSNMEKNLRKPLSTRAQIAGSNFRLMWHSCGMSKD